jgi:hypothetical protein
MHSKILLCADLDRTILPNGPQEESPQARPVLRALVARPEVTLVYVSGRHKALLLEAIGEYDIPVPDYAIGDVGTTIYEIVNGQWHAWEVWSKEIAPDWDRTTHDDLVKMLADIDILQLQEPEKQNTFKLSYYAPEDTDRDALLVRIKRRLDPHGIRASLIWSIDEIKHLSLLDVLPECATKLHAIQFLMQQKDFDEAHTVFAGDSGNDLPVLTSGLQAILVGNSRAEVREEAQCRVEAAGWPESLYIACGEFLGMNGNYTAGVLEGLAHFMPETQWWMREAC